MSITGTREYSVELRNAMGQLHESLCLANFTGIVLHGDCKTGADTIAAALWDCRIVAPCGALAGAARALLEVGVCGAGYAFPRAGSRGTTNAIRQLREAGLAVTVRRIAT